MQDFPSGRGRRVVEAESGLLKKIESVTDWLIKRARSENGEARQRVFSRLLDVYHTEFMTPDQKEELGELIWAGVGENDLPGLNLAYFSFLHLPSPSAINVTVRIRNKILELNPVKLVSTNSDGELSVILDTRQDEMIREVSMATKPVILLQNETKGEIEWSPEEAKSFCGKVLDWWDNDKVMIGEMGMGAGGATMKCLNLFLARAVFPYMQDRTEDEWDQILDLISEARDKGLCLAACRPYILLHRTEHKTEIETDIRDSLATGAENEVKGSSLAVRHWIHLANKDLIEEPASDLLESLINRVIFRRREGIQSCIQQVSYLLVDMPDSFSWEAVQSIIASLVPWHGAIELPLVDGSDGDFTEEERPDLRELLGMLSGALSKWVVLKKSEIEEPSEIKLWRETCDQDPLPEVNRSFRTWDDFVVGNLD